MVGYLDDATVGSKIRVRFDIGLNMDTPDRAEFFYAKCGVCYSDLDEDDPNFDPDAPGPNASIDVDFRQFLVLAEAGGPRLSVFAEIPIRMVQGIDADDDNPFLDASGLSDLRGGVRIAALSRPQHAVTIQALAYLPTGDAAKGLGTNHGTVEGSVLFYGELSPTAAIEGQAGLWVPLGGSAPLPTDGDGKFAGKVLFYGVGPSVEVFRRGAVSFGPVVELAVWHVLSGNQTSNDTTDASGTVIANLKFGARVSWNQRGSLYAGYGRVLTEARWYSDIFRVEYRHSF
jgi:hypothetical protein